MKNGSGPRRSISSSSSSSSGRRSSNSAFSLGTGPVRGPGSWTRGGGSSRSSTSSKVSGGRVIGGGGGGSENQEVVVSTAAAAAGGPPEKGRGRTAERAEQGCARAPPPPPQLTSALEGDEAENKERGEYPVQPRVGVDDEVTGVGACGGTDACSGSAAAAVAVAKPEEASWAGEDDKVGGEGSTVNPGREASYGTVTSSVFCSGVGDTR